MDDGARYRHWIADSPRAAARPDPGRMLAPLLVVAASLATPTMLPVPVAVAAILAALSWLGARIQESASPGRGGAVLRTGSGDGPRSRDPRACSDGWR